MKRRFKYYSFVAGAVSTTNRLRSLFLTSVAGATLLVATAPGWAQDASTPETVTVTGTLIQRPGYSAPTPVTTVSAQDLAAIAPTNVGDAMSNIPSFVMSSTPNTSGVNSLGGGETESNLRGLGANRNLVLVDGERWVPVATDGTVDLTQIPTLLIDHIDVVTGGASASYGSDAVSGVVNISLKKHIDGVTATAEYGESEFSDSITEQVALAAGGQYFGGKLNLMLGLDYTNNEGILSQFTRPWGRESVGLITNAAYATNGQPNYIIAHNVQPSTMSAGGLILSGPLKGTAFGPGGTPYQFNYGTVYGSSMIGGEADDPNPTLASYLGSPYTAYDGLARATYSFTPNLQGFFDFSAAHTWAGGASQQTRDTADVIYSGNPYLPASVQTAMTADHLSSITVGRYYDDPTLGPITRTDTNNVFRGVGGFRGTLWNDWTWQADYQYGQDRYNLIFGPNNRNQQNFTNALNAVVNPANGQIVCSSTLTNPGNGCMPVDILGSGSETVNGYVNGSALYHLVTEQTVASVGLNGNAFSTWAGPISFAGGLEYRREAGRAIADPVSMQIQANGSSGGWDLGNQKSFAGAYNIYEGYLETVVPLAKDLPLAEEADINAAVRLDSYSSSGGVTTWKVGFNYQPIDDLRIRGTRSTDIRAPNLSELFIGGTGSSYTSVFDQVLGQSVQIHQIGEGNQNLSPEVGTTWTGGFVYQPNELIPNLSFSADYYSIKITNVISQLGAPQLAAGCYAGNQLYCKSVTFNSDGTIAYIVSQSLNLNALETSGVDLEASYNIAADQILGDLPGEFDFHLLNTYVNDFTTFAAGQAPYNTVGSMSQFNRIGGIPRWSGSESLIYNFDPYSINLRGRYVGAGVYSYALTTGTGAANTINNNYVPGIFYLDVGGAVNHDFGGVPAQFYFTINNLFDTPPPFVPSGAAGGTDESSTNTTFYDVIGRYYKVGIRVSLN